MKPDSDEIKLFLDNLAKKSWLASRSVWVKYIFHHTDIHNVIEILKSGKLLCRRLLEETGRMPVDNASRPIISSTESAVKNYVRLYFRPRNPTQYRNEGVRPLNRQWEESHCPVPVFLLFDSKEILTLDDCQFSEGNLASTGIQGLHSTVTELEMFDFRKIYHDSPHNDRAINFHKNAEVVVLNELDLSALRYIVCRSPAEKETLLNLLPTNIFNRWSSKIVIDTKVNFFFRRWSFLQTVELTAKYAAFNFSPDTIEPGPFHLIVKRRGSEEKSFENRDFYANEQVVFEFPEDILVYEIEVELDGNLIYSGRFDGSDEIPF
ncbi:MAG TPA: DarT ssDNA thymidine ADP-ribosyltransferase family protein [Pyrinomonadaceae bacterium]|nr:DarT ssDNA thymidine ADP-ribosyltransferase family protein [Pyrinomonadaceae bacterium]